MLGVAVLASVFTAHGGYASPQAFVDGMTAALPIGAAVLGGGRVAGAAGPGQCGAQVRERRRAGAGAGHRGRLTDPATAVQRSDEGPAGSGGAFVLKKWTVHPNLSMRPTGATSEDGSGTGNSRCARR